LREIASIRYKFRQVQAEMAGLASGADWSEDDGIDLDQVLILGARQRLVVLTILLAEGVRASELL
jgi:hypothetical protein